MTFEDSLRTILSEELEQRLKGHIIDDEPLISRKEIMRRLDVSDHTFRNMCKDHELPYYTVGTSGVKYRYSEVLEILKKHHKAIA